MRLSDGRKAFLLHWAKTTARVFLILWLLLTWIFQGSAEGGAIWAALLTVFVAGGGVYLRWHDALSDQDVLDLLDGAAVAAAGRSAGMAGADND